jgi:N-acyl-D-amino-acid deacylase
VLDGSGPPWVYADVGINGDRIAVVGRLSEAKAKKVIEAAGLDVAPGFIDEHSQAGPALAGAKLTAAEGLLAQGITTVFVNPDGGGPTDLAMQRGLTEKHRPEVNVAQLIGHSSVRIEVMGKANRAPTDAEQAQMNGLVRRAMQAGALDFRRGHFIRRAIFQGPKNTSRSRGSRRSSVASTQVTSATRAAPTSA